MEQQILIHSWWESKMVVTSANSSAVSYKSKHTLLLSSFHSLVFTPMNQKHVHKRTCTRVFLEALFIIVKTWKQARFPLVVSWINKLVRLDNRIFISKKKETIMPWKSMVGDFLPWSFSGKDSVFPVQGSWVWSLVRELKSHILHGVARKKKTHGKMLYTFC